MNTAGHTLRSVRRSHRLTQKQLAAALGLRSKGYISKLEGGLKPIPLRLALEIQRWSDGKLRAADLCPDAAHLLGAPTGAAAA
jgi:transcriptional regulator with XRE-family HTH domain